MTKRVYTIERSNPEGKVSNVLLSVPSCLYSTGNILDIPAPSRRLLVTRKTSGSKCPPATIFLLPLYLLSLLSCCQSLLEFLDCSTEKCTARMAERFTCAGKVLVF